MAFTVNKSIQQPANGSFNNDWDVPVNADWAIIDNAFGGHSVINVTGVTAGTYTLTLAQYQPPIIVFTGTITANLVYQLPAGVGGIWSVQNVTIGAFTVGFKVTGSVGTLILAQGFRTLVLSDGSGPDTADDALPLQAQANAQAFATAADVVVTTNTEAFATAAANTAQSNAETFSANASNLSSGTVPNAQLPNVGIGPGVIIQADPGGTPTGPPGTLWLYY
jgi:hypothetical protein